MIQERIKAQHEYIENLKKLRRKVEDEPISVTKKALHWNKLEELRELHKEAGAQVHFLFSPEHHVSYVRYQDTVNNYEKHTKKDMDFALVLWKRDTLLDIARSLMWAESDYKSLFNSNG